MSVQLHRSIDILEFIHASEKPLSLGEIAARLDLPKPAAHRLLQVWLERGYVDQEPDSQRYLAALKLAILGFGHLAATGIRDVCYPELRRLAAETGELARLAVEHRGTLTWVVEAQGARDGLRYDGNLGRQAILHATAAGKAWLSTLSDEDAVRHVLAQGFRAPPETGPAAVRTLDGLLSMLKETRLRGYATSFEEASIGVSSVATPIFDGSDRTRSVGSIIVVGPSVRVTRLRIAEIAPLLQAAAVRTSALWPIRRHMVATDAEDILGAA